jgi:hypothetical protein
MDSARFYADLPAYHGSLQKLLLNESYFQPVPTSWCVIVTDVQGSTQAVNEGRGRDLNTVAASCVIAALNVTKAHGCEIAFFYGGDGATLIVPEGLREEIVLALQALRANTFISYSLRLRVGSVSVSELLQAGKQLRIAKWAVAPGYDQAVFLGDGLALADSLIKADPATSQFPEEERSQEVDLTGLMCRWQEIQPVTPKEEVVCAIIDATDTNMQATVYAQVLQALDETYGEYQTRHPVNTQNLTPNLQAKNLQRKALLSSGGCSPLSFVKEFIRACLSTASFKTSIGIAHFQPQKYLEELLLATDTLHVAGSLLTIISGTAEQRLRFREALEKFEQSGMLIFGLAVCPASVMTCYVQRYDARHIHFLDGQDGGYTQASKEWKTKRKASKG